MLLLVGMLVDLVSSCALEANVLFGKLASTKLTVCIREVLLLIKNMQIFHTVLECREANFFLLFC